jgi:Lrp/AsnC family transcriptional regulator, leucine-responsive regulatory protein
MPAKNAPIEQTTSKPSFEPLDPTNLRLLRELHADPRITMSALARQVGMSSPAVTERVQRLQRSGVITGFRMDVDPAAIGLPVTAFARIRPAAGQLPKVAELAGELVEVSECYRITGEDCFLVKVHAPTIGDLEQVLDRFLLYGQTVTSIVVSNPVPPRALPIAAHPDDRGQDHTSSGSSISAPSRKVSSRSGNRRG